MANNEQSGTYLSVDWTCFVSMSPSCRGFYYRKGMNTIYKVYDVVCYYTVCRWLSK